jgi:hypothetical protein
MSVQVEACEVNCAKTETTLTMETTTIELLIGVLAHKYAIPGVTPVMAMLLEFTDIMLAMLDGIAQFDKVRSPTITSLVKSSNKSIVVATCWTTTLFEME